ncbi:MAG: hypothetical protein PHP83_01325 [Clostridia bacterium]|nr:hypothetical protein [Clostridia bacterium]
MNSVLTFRNYAQWVVLMENCKNYELRKRNIDFNLFSTYEDKQLYKSVCDKYENYQTKEYYLMLMKKELQFLDAQKDKLSIKGKFVILNPMNYFTYCKSIKTEKKNKNLVQKLLKDNVQFNNNSQNKISFGHYRRVFKDELNSLTNALTNEMDKEDIFVNIEKVL